MTPSNADSARAIIERLGLAAHPEGGWYKETWRDTPANGGRGSGTAILYLLDRGERSHWHRVDATEIWHFHAGAPLRLRLSDDGVTIDEYRLGGSIIAGEEPQITIPPYRWQSAEATEGWTLVSCTVSPAFDFAGFELAAPDWSPGR